MAAATRPADAGGAPAPEPAAPAHGGGYRPHLDGIRALAVVAVIAFHLGFTWIPGGFIGVDVFFVLSGYLITGLLLNEATRDGRLGLGRFYARRARRLLPASILVLAAVLVAGWFLFDPVEKESLGRDAIWSALYSANWRFATAGGDYFAPGDVPSPLVHYWSLAVEEQFYLVWPALFGGLFAWSRRRSGPGGDRRLVVVVGVLAAASLVASIVFVGTPLTYYGTQARAYQLLAGALLALAVRRGWRLPEGPAGRWAADGTAVAALVALGLLAHGIQDATRYPGWPGLAVTIASLALIVGADLGPRGRVTEALGLGAMAAVGRLSYSLYIWHWPVIVLVPVAVEHNAWPTWLAGRPALVAAMIALAGVSYLVVERPVRFRLRIAARPRSVVAVGLAASVLVAVVAYEAFLPDDRWEQDALWAVRDLAEPGPCPYFPEDWPAAADSEPCVYREGDGPVVAVVGDSHAQQWQPALEELARTSDARIIRATRGGCPANDVVAVARQPDGRVDVDGDCAEWRHEVYRRLVDEYDPDVVLVGTRSHVRGLRVADRNVLPSDAEHLPEWAAGWDWTLDTLASGGAQVVVSTIIPTLPQRVPACLIAQGPERTAAGACDFPVADDTDVVPYNQAIAEAVARHPGVALVDPTPIGCPAGTCPAMDGDVVVHRDDNHLSASFVRAHAAAFGALLASAGAEA